MENSTVTKAKESRSSNDDIVATISRENENILKEAKYIKNLVEETFDTVEDLSGEIHGLSRRLNDDIHEFLERINADDKTEDNYAFLLNIQKALSKAHKIIESEIDTMSVEEAELDYIKALVKYDFLPTQKAPIKNGFTLVRHLINYLDKKDITREFADIINIDDIIDNFISIPSDKIKIIDGKISFANNDIKLRRFTDGDWLAWSGATKFIDDSEPLYAELVDERLFDIFIVVDATGVSIEFLSYYDGEGVELKIPTDEYFKSVGISCLSDSLRLLSSIPKDFTVEDIIKSKKFYKVN